MKLKQKYLSIFFFLILLLISGMVYRPWLSFDIFTNGDWPFAFSSTIKDVVRLFVWHSINGLGSINFVLWRFPLDYLYGVLGVLGFGTNVSDKLLVFWPTLILANLASYLLVKKITKSNLAGFVGAIVFNYNTYYYIASTAFLLYAAAAWSIITLYIFIKATDRKKLYLFLISGLTLVITGSYDFRIAYITIFLLIFYFIFDSFYLKKFETMSFVKNLLLFTSTGVVFLTLNLYWILSFFAARSLSSNVVLDRGLFGNEFLNIIYSLSLYHPFWTGKQIAVFNPQVVMSYFWLIPIFAFLGLYLNRKNKLVLFFGIISLLGVFLTKQVGHPFTGVYAWLFQYFPGFNAFREASKFYYLVVLGYAVLIGSFISWLWSHWTKGELKIYTKYILTGGIVLIFSINSIPILNGVFGSIYVPLKIPEDYLKLESFIQNDNIYSRTLWVPRYSRWGMVSFLHPEISEVDEIYGDWNKFISSEEDPNVLFQSNLFLSILNKQFSNNLLNATSVKYIVVPLEDKASQDDFFPYYGNSRQYYIKSLDKITYLHKLNIGTKDLVIYENNNSKPHIYITQKKETVSKNLEFKTVESEFINGSEYKILLKNVSGSFYLNFSDNYNNNWEIRAGSFSWFKTLTDKNYFLPDVLHFKNDAGLNSFYLDTGKICKAYSCTRNNDGSYNIMLTLYFAPQSYMYLGLIIAGVVLIFVFGSLIFLVGKEINNGKDD